MSAEGVVRPLSTEGLIVATFVETVTASIFISGLQSACFSLAPLRYLGGEPLWKWSRIGWLSLALPTAFLLFHVVLNSQGQFATAIGTTSVRSLIILCVGAWVLTMSLWLYFRLRNGRGEDAGQEAYSSDTAGYLTVTIDLPGQFRASRSRDRARSTALDYLKMWCLPSVISWPIAELICSQSQAMVRLPGRPGGSSQGGSCCPM